jgi:hypothetical protein
MDRRFVQDVLEEKKVLRPTRNRTLYHPVPRPIATPTTKILVQSAWCVNPQTRHDSCILPVLQKGKQFQKRAKH